MGYLVADRRERNGAPNRLRPEDRAVHEWYRFVLSFPPHLVREYLARFGIGRRHRVLDPFCGTGTVLVECKKLGIPSLGIEANPMAHFASQVKVDWTPDPDELLRHARGGRAPPGRAGGARGTGAAHVSGGGPWPAVPLRRLPQEEERLLLAGSIGPLPLHKTLVLRDCLRRHSDPRYERHLLLALAKALVTAIGNLHFGPEVGVGPAKADAPVVAAWLAVVEDMARDLRAVGDRANVPAQVFRADARRPDAVLPPGSVDAVITSPPYPNEKDYTRTTRPQSVELGFIRSKAVLRALTAGLERSHTRRG